MTIPSVVDIGTGSTISGNGPYLSINLKHQIAFESVAHFVTMMTTVNSMAIMIPNVDWEISIIKEVNSVMTTSEFTSKKVKV